MKVYETGNTTPILSKAISGIDSVTFVEEIPGGGGGIGELGATFTPFSSLPNFIMVFVEKGSFEMGGKTGRDDKDGVTIGSYELPAHNVTLTKDFYIGKYEVTQEVWKYFMSNNNPSNHVGDSYPVEYVSWNDIQTFLPILNTAFHALGSQYSNYEFRLPTEAQWEYAARGGNKSQGYQYSGGNDVDAVAWYYDNSGDATHVVGGKAANELDLHDMSGNVYEWCRDYWSDNYNGAGDTDPECTTSSSFRVLRGGYWYDPVTACRVAFRGNGGTGSRTHGVGIRLVLVRVP
jgi:formylglycine-generating enzyme required for sulfatase activity